MNDKKSNQVFFLFLFLEPLVEQIYFLTLFFYLTAQY